VNKLLNQIILFFSITGYCFCDVSISPPWESITPLNQKDLLDIQSRLQELLPNAKKALVSIETNDGVGSGVIVSEDGLVLTAAHVIGKTGQKMNVRLLNGKKVSAISLGGSEISDAGMLKITKKGKWPFSPIAKRDFSKIGDWCFAIGHPGGFNKKRGVVVRLGRIIGKNEDTLQSDSRLLGGDSGGPLFDFNGNIIAIHSRVSKQPDQNFHVPIECFHINWDFYKDQEILTFEKLKTQGFLGVACEKTDLGLKVNSVVEKSAAEKYGLQKGDFLISLDGEKLDSREELTILISLKKPDELISLEYRRDETELSVQLALGARP
jgi:serine protease Do